MKMVIGSLNKAICEQGLKKSFNAGVKCLHYYMDKKTKVIWLRRTVLGKAMIIQ